MYFCTVVKNPNQFAFYLILVCFTFLTGCEQAKEIVPEVYLPKHAHEAYLLGLQKTSIANSALGKDWIQAAQHSLSKPIHIKSPYEENFVVTDREVKAFGYKLQAKRGHRIDILIKQLAGDSMKVFLDAFRFPLDSVNMTALIASADSTDKHLAFEVNEDGEYLIRFQTELLREGQFKIKIVTAPAIEFPVAGKGKSAIGSLFGVPRDAGKRKHEGIDIFSRRHTPIIAPCNGKINYAGVRVGSLGGKVIWMRDSIRNMTLYFAHLEDVFVQKGMRVMSGDTIGSVGNSGNAITTHPHLHFGLYQDGAIDPYDYVVPTRTKPSKMLAKQEHLGKSVRAKRQSTLREGSISSKNRLPIVKHQLLNVIGTTASYYHVSLPDEKEGFIFYDDIEALDRPIKRATIAEAYYYTEPNEDAIKIDMSETSETLKVMALNNEYNFVQTDDNSFGWILQ